jgi:predicted flavoprotein YhiN
MNVDNIGAINKTGQASLESRSGKKQADGQENVIEQTTPASKTFLSESSAKVNIKDPYQELSDFMKMTDAQKMQYLWLKKHGISQEEFAAMSDEEKQKLVQQMQEELKTQIQQAVESPDKSSLEPG